MQSALLGMKQVRQYVGKRLATKTLDTLIEELKRRLINWALIRFDTALP